MILLEANSDFFGKADVTSLYEWLEQAEISFQYLNLNLQQSVVFLENEKEDSYYIELAQWLCDRIEKEYQEKLKAKEKARREAQKAKEAAARKR